MGAADWDTEVNLLAGPWSAGTFYPSGSKVLGTLEIPSWTTTTRPTSPNVGRVGFNTTTGGLEQWSGTSWAPSGSGNVVLSTGSTTARTLASRFAEVVNVKDFGAVGDNTTDDTAAINAALNYIRANFNIPPGNVGRPFRLVFPSASYLVTAPLNFTGLVLDGAVIDGCGSMIHAVFPSGGAVIDCAGSRWLNFRDIQIYGDASGPPSIGIQIGRTASAVSADYHGFQNVQVNGNFSFTAFYNFASETVGFLNCEFRNYLAGSDKYCLVMDGLNHWGMTSTFVTVTAPTETAQSFNENVFWSCAFQSTNSSTGAIWISTTSRLKFTRCYASNQATSGHIFRIYGPAGGNSTSEQLDIDCHCETNSLANAFVFTAAAGQTSAYINGFSFQDHACFATTAIFAIDSGSSLTSVNLRSLRLRFNTAFGTPSLFDNATKWNATPESVVLGGTVTFNKPVGTGWRGFYTHLSSPGAIYLPPTYAAVAANGGSVTIPQMVEWVELVPAATIAGYTLTMPLGPGGAAAIGGHTITITTTQTITTLTVNGNTGQTVLGTPGTLNANTSITYRYDSGASEWICLGKTS